MAILCAILFQLELQVHGQEPIFENISMDLHMSITNMKLDDMTVARVRKKSVVEDFEHKMIPRAECGKI